MNLDDFTRRLQSLDEAAWQRVIGGESILIIDDMRLEIGSSRAPNAVIGAAQEDAADAASLKQRSLAEAAALLTNYYLTHPLTRTGFNHQVGRLMEKHGIAAFTALPGHLPAYSLFVDGGEVVAEASGSPRHRYGVYCELPRPLADAALQEHINRWLQRGEAHERYLSMNVCRYNC